MSKIAVVITCVDDLLLTGDTRRRSRNWSLPIDLGVPGKLVGEHSSGGRENYLRSITSYTLYMKGIVILKMGSMDVRRVYIPSNPVIDLTAKQDGKKELDAPRLCMQKKWESRCFWLR